MLKQLWDKHMTQFIYCPALKYTLGTDAVDKCWRLLLSMTSIIFYVFVLLEKNIFAELLNKFIFFLSHTLRNELYFRFHSFISSFCFLILNSFFFILSFRKIFCPGWYFSGFYLTFFLCFASWFFFIGIFFSFIFVFLLFSFFLSWVLNIFLVFINFIL